MSMVSHAHVRYILIIVKVLIVQCAFVYTCRSPQGLESIILSLLAVPRKLIIAKIVRPSVDFGKV